ncbi:MAG TPA: PAS-domain containing protein [Pseudolabrys sp.]|nr:PAS-domain containing protein [Pseudolabrys sp.]
MPETTRTANERLCSRPMRLGVLAGFAAAALGSTLAAPARAEAGLIENMIGNVEAISHEGIPAIAVTVGLLCLAVLAIVVLLRTRRSAALALAAARDEAALLRAELDHFKVLLLSQPQILVAWPAGANEPEIIGDTSIATPGPLPERVLAFGGWLEAAAAQRMERAVEALRNEGRGFVMTLTTSAGRPLEAEGRAVAGRAVLRLRDVSGIESELMDLASRHDRLSADVATMKTLLDALPSPVWARDQNGRLVFVNAAYARAVDAENPADAVKRELELLDRAVREDFAQRRADGGPHSARVPAIAAGERRIFDVVDATAGLGSAGMAIDATEVEAMRAELARSGEAHRRVLDQLATGVAIFDAGRKLAFYNSAFRLLFALDPAVLDETPTDSAVLETLRAARKLPEETDFRQWKQQLHEAYRAVEPQEHLWHLPDGRTLRVVTAPNPEGGVTYLYDDVTERLDMRRRYDALIKVQRETLDHLAEAVAVFGSDGRVRLHNPAFQRMWRLSPESLDEHPHIEAVTAWTQALHDDSAVWRNLRATVTAIDDREPIAARIERRDGMMIDMTAMPLPDGATLVTFLDVSDSVNVERALIDKNEALQTADAIKIDFVHHVSYELRSPLTNIIGFAHFLGDAAFGPLNDKQREYLGYITASTNALLALINNILDLATIDAGAMALNLTDVNIRACMEEAAEGVQDRLKKDGITLDIRSAPGIGSFTADQRRLRQILFDLLSNAVGFSPPGETVTLAAERRADTVVFSVADHGPGIPPEAMDKVFDWFETDSMGSHHRGSGLGLSLVRSFVELHGGTVTIDSALGKGTTVTCVLPANQQAERSAA